MDVSFKLNGPRVSRHRLGPALERAVGRDVDESVADKLRSMRCPIHGCAPRVVRQRGVGSRTTWDITGCCGTVIRLARCCVR